MSDATPSRMGSINGASDKFALDSNNLGIYFSPSDQVNKDIFDHLGGMGLDDYIGDAQEAFEDKYDELQRLNRIYFNKYKQDSDKTAYLNELKLYLLATAEYTKNSSGDEEEYNKFAKSNVNWIDIIFDGGSDFDPIFDGEVDKLLEKRNSISFIQKDIRNRLKKFKDDYKLIEAINRKMNDCAQSPDGYMEYITSDITWNNNNKCLECPEEDCLIYIYDYYYGFLNQQDNIHMLDKIYILMLCEARICILSKCIVLEALRQERGDKQKVKSILQKIYERDVERKNIKANIPEDLSTFTMIKKPSQSGGAGDREYGEGPIDKPFPDPNDSFKEGNN